LKKIVYNEIKKNIDSDFSLEKPKDNSFGHYATPVAFSLAKILRKSPMIIADELCQKFGESNCFESVESVKGYINFKLSSSFLDDLATKALNDEENFAKDTNSQKILLEYVSANPTGPLHIGHSRGAVFGDTLYKVAKHLGYDIESEYYVNDAGNQIRLLGVSIFLGGQEILGKNPTYPEEYYRGEYILDLAKEAIDEFGEEIFSSEDSIEKLSVWGKDKMLELIKQNLKEANIEFDHFVSEKELFKLWDETLKKLKANDAVYEKDGKIWLKSSEYGDEKDRVVVREDKRATYLAGDIIYHNQKFERGYDHYINIWGADHHGYIARVKAAIKFLGFDENRLEVILSQMVSLLKGGQPYKMSKRAGNFILMSDIVKEIGSDALRFIFLTKKSDTHLEFDVDDLKKQDSSNPIYYVNYAHARINQLLEKSSFSKDEIVKTTLKDMAEDEKNLLFNALLLNEVLNDAFNSRQLQKLSEYLKNLASLLHQFYNKHQIVGSQKEKEYLKIMLVVALSIRTGLKLMGIDAKYKM
jgi:arginyl-tRNA synthetase